jgi:hypothetical protein
MLMLCSVARPEVKPHKVASAHPVPEHIPKPPWYLGKSPPTDPPPEVHGPEVQLLLYSKFFFQPGGSSISCMLLVLLDCQTQLLSR